LLLAALRSAVAKPIGPAGRDASSGAAPALRQRRVVQFELKETAARLAATAAELAALRTHAAADHEQARIGRTLQ
jgi:hypothetical protein